MAVRSKGFYFSFDALMATLVIFFAFFTVMQMDTGQRSTLTNEYQQADTAAEDALQLALSSPFRSAFNETEERRLLNDTELVADDLDRSVMDVLAVLWASNETAEARDLARKYFSRIVPDEFSFRVRIANEGSTTIYASSGTFNESSIVARSSRMVSGVSRNRPTRGFTATASLTSLGAVQSRYFFFGGYVGDGNVTANVTLPEYHNIVAAEMEGDFGGNVSLTVNGQPAGMYSPSATNLSADRFTVCNSTYASSRCDAFTPGGNEVRLAFTGNGTSIGGGFFRVDYNDTESLQVRSGEYITETDRFPGVNGIINIFGSFHVPGTLRGLSADLHYRANTTTFLKVGNVTVYSNTTGGETRVTLENATLASRLAAANVSLRELSNATVPVRLGVRNLSDVEREEADSVAVIDVSGSMGDDPNNDGTTLLDEAKNASKTFVDIVLGVEENRAGMVSYESTIDTVHELTTSPGPLKNTIDTLSAGGNTCTGCGILEAIDVVNEPAYERVIPRRSVWRWNASFPASEPPTIDGMDWTETGYDDGAWRANRTIAGIGRNVDSVLPDNGGDYFFRKEFDWDWLDYNTFQAFVRSEDAATVYINGELIYNETASHDGRYWNKVLNGLNPVFEDSFERDAVGPNWTVTSGTAGDEVAVGTDCGAAEGSRAMLLRWGGATVESQAFDFSDRASMTVTYEIKQGGGGGCEPPESGEDVEVQYLDSGGTWQTLKTHPAAGSDPSRGTWGSYSLDLPSDALHSDFKLRYRFPSGSGSDYDYWAVDAVAFGDSIQVNDSLLRDGTNVVAVRLKNDGQVSSQNWTVDTEEEWAAGTFTNTTADGGSLELDPSTGAVQEDVDASRYCPVSGGDTSSGMYMDRVAFRGIDRQTGNNGGYVDATDSITDKLVPGQSYEISVTMYTEESWWYDYPQYASVAIDWDGDGEFQDQSVTEIGSCSSDGCTVSTTVTVPSDAALGSTMMRVMGEYDEYHTAPCTDTDYNEMEDYSVFVNENAYISEGNYTSERLDAGQTVDWTGAVVDATVPSATDYNITYRVNGTSYADLGSVPDARYLAFNVSLATDDPGTTPSLDAVHLGYEANEAEFDFALNGTMKRNRSMVVMSDGAANRETSMTDVPDWNGDGSVDGLDHTIEAAHRACTEHSINVYTIGFGSGADEETLNMTAEQGCGEYFYASTGELTDIFRRISETILEATERGQQLLVQEGAVNQTLFPDSALRLNYSQVQRREFGKFRITQESARFGGNVSSPKNGSFDVPEETALADARLLSYSSKYWTDRVTIQNTTGQHEYVYRLWRYGRQYDDLGDPYLVHLPPSKATVGARNNVSVDTALAPNRTVGGSNFSRVVYDLLVDGFVGYGDVFNESTGGTTNVTTDYGSFMLEVGNATDAWEPRSDAIDNATERLLNKLDVDDDGSVDFQIDSDNLQIDQNSLSGLRWLWGPAIVSVEVWK